MKMASKKATSEESHGQDSPYFVGWQEYEKNPYHPNSNTSGIIQMGLAENQDLSWGDKDSSCTLPIPQSKESLGRDSLHL
ncbi:hypothetical protein K1719_030944 [Acacia pycnantha]|nr:hypothetical protein K1719_030944 [Acacia pycnantha]